jgi:hypothetical protein
MYQEVIRIQNQGASCRAGAPLRPGRTGLSACIFFASGKKGYRFYPLRVPKSGIPAGFGHRSFALQNSIYPPAADSNGNSGIPAARPSGACRNTPGEKLRSAIDYIKKYALEFYRKVE